MRSGGWRRHIRGSGGRRWCLSGRWRRHIRGSGGWRCIGGSGGWRQCSMRSGG